MFLFKKYIKLQALNIKRLFMEKLKFFASMLALLICFTGCSHEALFMINVLKITT